VEKTHIDELMEHLVQDLVELEKLNSDEKIIELVTETYQKVYNELAEIKRS